MAVAKRNIAKEVELTVEELLAEARQVELNEQAEAIRQRGLAIRKEREEKARKDKEAQMARQKAEEQEWGLKLKERRAYLYEERGNLFAQQRDLRKAIVVFKRTNSSHALVAEQKLVELDERMQEVVAEWDAIKGMGYGSQYRRYVTEKAKGTALRATARVVRLDSRKKKKS